METFINKYYIDISIHMTELSIMQDKLKRYKKILKWVSIISGIIIIILLLYLRMINGDLDFYSKTCEWKCPEGTKKECIEDSKVFISCDKTTQQAICIDKSQSIGFCDKYKREYSVCIGEGNSYVQCTPSQGYATCWKNP